MENKAKEPKKRAGPNVLCCGCLHTTSLCADQTYRLVKPTDKVLVLGSSLEPIVSALEYVTAVTWLKEDGSRRVIDHTKQIRKKGTTGEEAVPANVTITYGDLHNLFEVFALGRFQITFVDPNSFSGQKLLIYSLSIVETLIGLFPESRALVCCSAILCDHVAVRFVNGPQLAKDGKKAEKEKALAAKEASIEATKTTTNEPTPTQAESTNIVPRATLSCYVSVQAPDYLLSLPKVMQKPGRVVGTFGVSQYRDVIPYVCLETDNVLEIGCQHGITTMLIAKHCSRGQIFGVDIGKNSIDRAVAVQEERRTRKRKVIVDGVTTEEDSEFLNAPKIKFSVGDGFDVEALAAVFGPRARSEFVGVHVIFVDMGGLSSRHAVLDLVSYTERLWASFAPTLRAVVVKSMAGLHLACKYKYVYGKQEPVASEAN